LQVLSEIGKRIHALMTGEQPWSVNGVGSRRW
jgi:hypothetical protein